MNITVIGTGYVDIVTTDCSKRQGKNLNDDAKLDVISLSNKNIADTLLNNTILMLIRRKL